MKAPLLETTDAVAETLNHPGTSLSFTAVRKYVTVASPEPLEEMETLAVTVMPQSITGLLDGRNGEMVDHNVLVAVQRRVDPEHEEVDELMALVQEIIDRLLGQPLLKTGMVCVNYDNNPSFSPEDLGQQQMFTSITTFTFRGRRAR